jgi:hypothetical protein
MKANYYISFVTDLVRTTEPLIKDVCKDLCSDFEDFVFTAYLRFMGIKRNYPTANFERTEKGAKVFVDGVMVYELELLHIDPEPVDISDED